MQQHKKFWLLPTMFIMIGLTGCGNDESAIQDRRNDNDTIPIGYYSNENHDGNGGNAILLEDDNDGPATEALDHSLGKERGTNRQGIQNMKNKSGVYKINNREVVIDGREEISNDDRNYHGHLSNQATPSRRNNHAINGGKQTEQITSKAKRVENVKDAQTVIREDTIIVGVLLNDGNKVEETKKNIASAIEPYRHGRTVKILTNESQYNRIKVINNDIQNGGPMDDLDHEIQNIKNSKENIDQ
ncbi:YhcN/YlaJ family sporulation lipoprotein [Bacillus tuaregi]|uniref:YhcN/YlaJ family sporulation lipoprotein n=1 Tax=Bacillus tuaregi TaxID=1816695 RepID=UPI0008F84A3E|nr:YhcN/YlaJ family sporulation lipoprotein [Bacillus tuaregi]